MKLNGHWTFTQCDEMNSGIGNWLCSNCGRIFLGKKEEQYNYCPYCGADMREEQEAQTDET